VPVIIALKQQETQTMKTMRNNRVLGFKGLSAAMLAVAIATMVHVPTATAGHGAAWGIGGLLAGHFLTDMSNRKREQTQALNTMAYGSPSGHAVPAVVAVQAPSPTMSIEQKLNELNKLAAGGYITPEEYKAKKQALLNSL
jgi:hypothetical protein